MLGKYILMLYRFKIISGTAHGILELDVPSSTTIGQLKTKASSDLKIDISNIGIFTETTQHFKGVLPNDLTLRDIMPEPESGLIVLSIVPQQLNVTVTINDHSHTISCNYDDTFLKIKTRIVDELGIDFSKLSFDDVTITASILDDIHGGAKIKK